MHLIFASQYSMPCVVADDGDTAQEVIDRCWEVEAVRTEFDGFEFCAQLRSDVGPELWTESSLRRSLERPASGHNLQEET